MADADSLVTLLRRWWFELFGALLALALGGLAAAGGDALSLVLVALVLVVLADRTRLRLDNGSLREQVTHLRVRGAGEERPAASPDAAGESNAAGDAGAGTN